MRTAKTLIRLGRVFAGRTAVLLVLSCSGLHAEISFGKLVFLPITYSFSLIKKAKVAYLGVGNGGSDFHLFSSRSILRKKSRGFVSVAIPPITSTLSSRTII